MKTLERGQDKIQKICDIIRRETIEPAKQESQTILMEATQKAEEIIQEAENQAEQLIKQARHQIEQERNVFNSSLQQAAKQAVEALRQELEKKFFNEELQTLLDQKLSNPDMIANLLNAIVKAIEKEGLATEIGAVIPRNVSSEQVVALLLQEVKNKLSGKPLEVGNFKGGVQVKLRDKKMTLDITDQTIKELLGNYVRKDFRNALFGHAGKN